MSLDPGSFNAGSFSVEQDVPEVVVYDARLQYNLKIPSKESKAIVIFVHGRDSHMKSKRNEEVAEVLNKNNISTLLFIFKRTKNEKL